MFTKAKNSYREGSFKINTFLAMKRKLWYRSPNSSPSINGLFVQYLRYAQKIILGILNICLRLFFSHALIFDKNPYL